MSQSLGRRRSTGKSRATSTKSIIYHFDIDAIDRKIEEYVNAFFPPSQEEPQMLKRSFTKESVITFLGFPVEWKQELMNIPFAPKYPLSSFARKGCRIFLSKKKPLLIIANLASHEEIERSIKEYEQRMHCQEKHLSLVESKGDDGPHSHRVP